MAAVRNYRRDAQQENVLAKCSAEHSNMPCYYYELDPKRCAETGFSLQVEWGGEIVPSDTQIVAHCEAN